jgi:hypothetical protein
LFIHKNLCVFQKARVVAATHPSAIATHDGTLGASRFRRNSSREIRVAV